MKISTVATLLLTACATTTSALAQTRNLALDWSDTQNANGPWSYRVGTTLLPPIASWTAGVSFPVVQPAFMPTNSVGSFLPAWYKATSVPIGFDSQVGDVIVHTNDNFNGNEALGAANILFTAPSAGVFNVSGKLWNASTTIVCCDFARRPQDWQILVNGQIVDGGTLSAVPGEFTRASPEVFTIDNLSLPAGGTIQLSIYRNSMAQAGFFVGADMTVQAVPEPSTWALLMCGACLLSVAVRSRARSLE